MPEIAYAHRLSAHCESGVTASLLTHHGLPLSEPMAFGIAAGLFFIHLPVKTLFGAPNTIFRSAPGNIFKKTCRRLGVPYQVRTYRDPEKGARDLEALVESGTPVGVQTNVYWLSHMPRRFRFQFNAHNLVVYGKGPDGWKVSDPVLDQALVCTFESMQRARFAKGFLAPRGKLYFLGTLEPLGKDRLVAAVRAGVKDAAFSMARIPVPVLGGKAIGLLADRMERWPRLYRDPQDSLMQLATVVRMAEEIGTGGAGFRYLYAAFLQEAGALLEDPRYLELSARLTAIGDTWRQFAGKCARIFRSQKAEDGPFAEAAALVRDCGVRERALFEELYVHEKNRGRKVYALPAAGAPP